MKSVLGCLLFLVYCSTIVKASDDDSDSNSTQSERSIDMMHVLPLMAQDINPEPCECSCLYDDDDYYNSFDDSWDYYDGYDDSWEYNDDHREMEHLYIFKQIGYFLPKISGEISHIRPIIQDIRMMISEWNSLSALEDLISWSSEKILLKDILPRNFNYSIVGEQILQVMNKIEVEKLLDVAEDFFRSKEFGSFAFHLMTFDDNTPMIEYLIEGLKVSEVLQSHMLHFDNVTWIRKVEASLMKISWLNVLIYGAGDIFRIQPFIHGVGMFPFFMWPDRFGGCSEASVIRRCADDTFASIETVQLFHSIIGGGTSASAVGKDDDPGLLTLMDCVLHDWMCYDRPPSVKKVADIIRPQFDNSNGLDCYNPMRKTCNAEKESTSKYIGCYQEVCQ